MSNVGGVRKRGLTLAVVAPVVEHVLGSRFPGVFRVTHTADTIVVAYVQSAGTFLAWTDQGDHYPGLIGGKHPRIGPFGYWILSVIEYDVANALDARVFDEGVGYYHVEDVHAGPSLTYQDYTRRGSERSALSRAAAYIARGEHRRIVEASAPELLPWFDGKEIGHVA